MKGNLTTTKEDDPVQRKKKDFVKVHLILYLSSESGVQNSSGKIHVTIYTQKNPKNGILGIVILLVSFI